MINFSLCLRIIKYTILKRITLLLIIITTTSCSVFKTKDHYVSLPQSWQELVVPLKTFELASRSEITKINGQQLQLELKNHKKAVVLFVVNYCPSNSNLKHLETYCLKNEYKLFIVMYNFDRVPFIFNQDIETPIFVMDSDFYKNRKENDYIKAFENDLGDNFSKYTPYYIFYNGTYQPNLGEEFKTKLTNKTN